MRLHSLLYVSQSSLEAGQADKVVQSIVDAAVVANQQMSITGALIFTRQHFAQIIEGDFSRVEDLIQAITRDERHRQLRVLERLDIGQRRFSKWAMSYSGPSQYVSRHVAPLLEHISGTSRDTSIELLKNLLAEFAAEI